MQKDIPFTGFSAAPSDNESADGELAQSFNLINEDGALRSVLSPKVMFTLPENHIVAHIHKSPSFREPHYIVVRDGTAVMWRTMADPTLHNITTLPAKAVSCESVGNTIIIIHDTGTTYLLWKGQDNDYAVLGSRLPECPLSFGLKGELDSGHNFSISFDDIPTDSFTSEFSANNKNRVSDQVLAKVNKYIADYYAKKGKHIFPFLLRYAYRLYDGSLTMHSAPILMLCSTDVSPQVLVWNVRGSNGNYNSADLSLVSVLHTLDYDVVSPRAAGKLLEWSDIITSVDVFISKPIYLYDQNGKCKRFTTSGSGSTGVGNAACVCWPVEQKVSSDILPKRYQYRRFIELYDLSHFTDMSEYKFNGWSVILPRRSADDVKNEIKNCAQFYFYASVKVADIGKIASLKEYMDPKWYSRSDITVDENFLSSLVTHEVMTDDYDSHDTLAPGYAFAYNSRLNLANIRKELFRGHNPLSVFCYSDGHTHKGGSSPVDVDFQYRVTAYVYIKQDGRDIVVQSETGTMGANMPFFFFYYPNPNAYKVVFCKESYFPVYCEFPLEKHNFLNGAFWFGGLDGVTDLTSPDTLPATSSDDARIVHMRNKIYTSDVNNPFLFQATNINTVGTGNIIAISSAAKALSQGQFGQFPLYAFTDEGVWALEVSSTTGGYSAKQPITRDVCTSSRSVTQIDSSVLFATERGIMQISGSVTQCITDLLDSPTFFDIASLPGLQRLFPNGLPKVDCSFAQYRDGAQMTYDYKNQRIFVFNPSKSYAYVFSVKSKLWGVVSSRLVTAVNAYPEAYAMARADTGNALVDLASSAETDAPGLLVTRPLKLSAGSLLKTVNTVFLRGLFDKSHVQMALYASRDNIHWHAVSSAKAHRLTGIHGSPHKYFRIVALTRLEEGETLLGASVEFVEKFTNKMR